MWKQSLFSAWDIAKVIASKTVVFGKLGDFHITVLAVRSADYKCRPVFLQFQTLSRLAAHDLRQSYVTLERAVYGSLPAGCFYQKSPILSVNGGHNAGLMCASPLSLIALNSWKDLQSLHLTWCVANYDKQYKPSLRLIRYSLLRWT